MTSIPADTSYWEKSINLMKNIWPRHSNEFDDIWDIYFTGIELNLIERDYNRIGDISRSIFHQDMEIPSLFSENYIYMYFVAFKIHSRPNNSVHSWERSILSRVAGFSTCPESLANRVAVLISCSFEHDDVFMADYLYKSCLKCNEFWIRILYGTFLYDNGRFAESLNIFNLCSVKDIDPIMLVKCHNKLKNFDKVKELGDSYIRGHESSFNEYIGILTNIDPEYCAKFLVEMPNLDTYMDVIPELVEEGTLPIALILKLANKLHHDLVSEKCRPPEKGGSEYEKAKEDFERVQHESVNIAPAHPSVEEK